MGASVVDNLGIGGGPSFRKRIVVHETAVRSRSPLSVQVAPSRDVYDISLEQPGLHRREDRT